MSDMQFDTDVPIPSPRRKRSHWKAELARMPINGSHLFEDQGKALSFRAAGYYAGYRMKIRKMPGDGWRVWRVA